MLQPVTAVTATNFSFKFAGFATVLLIADTMVPHLYTSLWPMFATTLAISIVGTVGDLVVLPRLFNGPSLILSFLGLTLITYVSAWLWAQSRVTFGAAILLGLAMLPIEYLLHRYVLKSLMAKP
ncbi:MAG: hypothetical protein A2201_10640 [Alicyclobacillus sp. RIFOXYA1_FULL_53_8]|nr:MAG: hypothetical protein A2201_10640 [Alicyclobacillus sp. RIFOXYA1_FULL_53_8]